MKAAASFSLLVGLFAIAQGQQTLKPSPTESVGCVAHGDHWDCAGPRVTSTGALATPTVVHDDDHDDDHDEDHHTTPTGSFTGVAAPSPTESYGCDLHGDHWHCKGKVGETTTLTGSGFTSVLTMTTANTAAGTPAPASATSTAGAARSQVTGFAAAGLAAAALAMAL